uniref:VWA domain-containing protein n=1 Tax=Candidatus Kentrum sp. DK TaxID=2126562 RepID=A0A450T4X7_9GAMM|nr:MAG: hypothetical protein BECKDK2373B_GA0170837_11037 [Candidatus Kentron sp. DK]
MLFEVLRYTGAVFFFLGGVALLYWLQEKRTAKQERTVAWRALFQTSLDTGARRRLWRWPLYILQCLALLLITFVLFDLHWENNDVQVIVLDRSLSMLSKGPDRKQSRFFAAKQEAMERIDPLTPVHLYSFGGVPRREIYSNGQAARRAIQAMRAAHSGGDLQGALDLLRADIDRVAIGRALVLTDHLNGEEQRALRAMDIPMDVRLIGGGLDNLYIDRLRVAAGFINRSPENILIDFRIGNVGGNAGRDRKFRYRMTLIDLNTNREHHWRSPQRLTLGHHRYHTETLTLATVMKRMGLTEVPLPAALRLELEPSGDKEILTADNRAWALLPAPTPIILGVFDRRLYEKLKGEFTLVPKKKTETTLIRRIEVLDLSETTPEAAPPFDIAVFNRTPPVQEERLSYPASLYILAHPSVENIRFPKDKVIQEAKTRFLNEDDTTLAYVDSDVISWTRADPLMDYLDHFAVVSLDISLYPFKWLLSLVSGASNREILQEQTYTPEWLRTVIAGQLNIFRAVPLRVPMVMKGSHEDRHTVVFNFDLADYDLTVHKDLKILLLNTIRWLHGNAQLPEIVSSGERFSIPWTNPGRLWIEGEDETLSVRDGLTPPLEQRGLYVLRAERAGRSHRFTVAPADTPDEYALEGLSPNTIAWGNGVVRSPSAVGQTPNDGSTGRYHGLIIWLLAGLLAVEFLLYLRFDHQRRRGRRGL